MIYPRETSDPNKYEIVITEDHDVSKIITLDKEEFEALFKRMCRMWG